MLTLLNESNHFKDAKTASEGREARPTPAAAY
jgi:hypothetical protein